MYGVCDCPVVTGNTEFYLAKDCTIVSYNGMDSNFTYAMFAGNPIYIGL